jgi:hypothetical protein
MDLLATSSITAGMIREEVWEIIEDSKSSGQVLPALNATFLTLIPKEEKINHPKQF